MRNAPLHSPPPASSHRSVLVITTNNKLGTSLVLLESRRTDVEEENRVLPFSFEGGPISTDEYFEKLEEMRERLAQWKGGLYTLLLVGYSIVLLVGFIAVYLTPQFWTSSFFDNPLYVLGVIGVQLGLHIWLSTAARSEFRSLRDDVEDLYRPWRARGVRVDMKRVATIGKDHEVQRRRQNIKILSGYNCFCVIMDIDHDEEEQDDGSVATAQTMDADSVSDGQQAAD
jgi:hypothetical protein